MKEHSRILAIDILRGLTIAGMILVNNPGGGEENCYAPLLHADWFGLTPTDLVFPSFMFIMGITTYLSLRKFNFSWSWLCARKIAKRAFLLWAIGIAISCCIMLSRGGIDWAHLRILGVLPRLGICYGLAAAIALSVKHKFIPWLIVIMFAAYYLILELGNGYAHDATNIIAIVDDVILGNNHVYKWETPDPEGILSTIPALAHVLIGFCVGKMLTTLKSLDEKIERLFMYGTLLLFAGYTFQYLCPISKKLWTPTFAMVCCGFGALFLALLTIGIDKKGNQQSKIVTFFQVFGVNPLALYVISDLLLIPLSILPICGGSTIQQVIYGALSGILPLKAASLAWAIIYVLINWTIGYWMYKKKIYIKL